MRIKQCKMLNREQEKFFSYFYKHYSLSEYNNINKPAIFFSLWSFSFIKQHKGLAVVIWRGSDIVRLKFKLNAIKKMKNVYHIAVSSYISKDLDNYGIKYKFIPIVGLDMRYYKPCVLGDEIYTYVPHKNSKKYFKRYGMKIIEKIRDKCKYKINIMKLINQYSRKKMVDIYRRSFCGLRLTEHDGLPNQVIEMGLMGRKSFYNGNIPGAIKWNKNEIDLIIDNINKESKKINSIDYKYGEKIKNFISINHQWMWTEFWEKR